MGEEAYAAFELGCTMASQDLSRLTTISFLRHTSRERTATVVTSLQLFLLTAISSLKHVNPDRLPLAMKRRINKARQQ